MNKAKQREFLYIYIYIEHGETSFYTVDYCLENDVEKIEGNLL